MGADGTNVQQLTDERQNWYPAWSPDGTYLAFLSNRERFWKAWISGPDGSGARSVLDRESDGPLDWAPDSRSFLFNPDDEPHIYSVRPDGTGLQQMSDLPRAIRPGAPAWSPDGTKIAFDAVLSPSIKDTHDVAVLDAVDGKTVKQLTNEPEEGGAHAPDWQPLPPPQRADFTNGPSFCRAEREHWGTASFKERYGGGPSAFGKCVNGR